MIVGIKPARVFILIVAISDVLSRDADSLPDSPGPKNGLESCVSRFSTICAKNLVLKLKIDEVTVIRVTKSPLLSDPPLY
jgi:hypothetical protein